MNDGGTQQTAPLVHNGVIFANNTGGIIQAIDARKGKVIWQYKRRRRTEHRSSRHRSLSGQGDLHVEQWPREGLGCTEWQGGLGCGDVGRTRKFERPTRGEGKSDSRDGWMRGVRSRKVSYHRL
jgi:outer membrane protein assembly factor BamB